ncbi:MAG: hypothetical protein AB3N10_13640 [Allomuricauda sp.]
MRKHILLFSSLFLLMSSSCEKNGENSSEETVNLSFTPDNLVGDWKRTAQFIGQANDTLGNLEPTEDLFAQFDNCRRDDLIRYLKGDTQGENTYSWGIGDLACHSQISNSFIEIGTWSIEESGKLKHINSNAIEYHIVILLTAQELRVRSELDKGDNGESTYEFTEYERIR